MNKILKQTRTLQSNLKDKKIKQIKSESILIFSEQLKRLLEDINN